MAANNTQTAKEARAAAAAVANYLLSVRDK
jgi:hypothetical protein